MEPVFFSIDNDNEYIIRLIKEANIKLASITDNNQYNKAVDKYGTYIIAARKIFSVINSNFSISDFIDTINIILNYGTLSPLTFNDDEFSNAGTFVESYYENTRCPRFAKFKNRIIDNDAYNCNIIKAYNHNDNTEIKVDNKLVFHSPRLYISKGGIITGEYIKECAIKDNIVNEHNFIVKPPIDINVSIIYDYSNKIVFVDHREPKLRELKRIYDYQIEYDDYIKNLKYNIRKYKKIN